MNRIPLQDDEHGGARFWVSLCVGVVVMGWGVWLFLGATSSGEARRSFATWLVGADLVHDLVVAPVVALAAWGLARVVPDRWWPPVQAGVVISAFVLLLAVLPLAGTAGGTGNPTIQPLNYATSTLTALALVWGAVGVWFVGGRLRRRWSGR
ncbi:MAG: hypothetical protein JNK12_04875 [Acidimicrobiales bacterium]|nr:hypothetical protein [Acidimicrobiales bacterium]